MRLNRKIFECMMFDELRQEPLHLRAQLASVLRRFSWRASRVQLGFFTLPATTTWTLTPRWSTAMRARRVGRSSKFQTAIRMVSPRGVALIARITLVRIARLARVRGLLNNTPTGGDHGAAAWRAAVVGDWTGAAAGAGGIAARVASRARTARPTGSLAARIEHFLV